MTKLIAVTNQKGGVGKTTSAVSIAAALSEEGLRVLLIDLDPQGNATVSCGYGKKTLEQTVMDVMLGDAEAEQVCLPVEHGGFALLPANEDLSALESSVHDHPQRHGLLKARLQDWVEQYDYVLIDCPPTLNLLTVNALVAAQYVLVPIQCEYFALEGVSSLLDTVGQIRRSVNPALRVTGFLRTMYDGRSRLTREVSNTLFANLKDLVFTSVVSRNVRLAEAPGYGMPITIYDAHSKGAKEYRKAAKELRKRLQDRGTS